MQIKAAPFDTGGTILDSNSRTLHITTANSTDRIFILEVQLATSN